MENSKIISAINQMKKFHKTMNFKIDFQRRDYTPRITAEVVWEVKGHYDNNIMDKFFDHAKQIGFNNIRMEQIFNYGGHKFVTVVFLKFEVTSEVMRRWGGNSSTGTLLRKFRTAP